MYPQISVCAAVRDIAVWTAGRLVLPLFLLLKPMLPLLVSVQGVVHRLLCLLKVSKMQGYGRVIINRSPEVLFRWRYVVICWWCMKWVRSTSSMVRISAHRKWCTTPLKILSGVIWLLCGECPQPVDVNGSPCSYVAWSSHREWVDHGWCGSCEALGSSKLA